MGKSIIISAINIVDGGALTVLQDAIRAFDAAASEHKVTFLVASPKVHEKIKTKSIRYEYFPASKKSWGLRFFFEYIYFLIYSIKKRPDIWLSLHDTTPNVIAKKRYVYCHNPSIFLKFPLRDILIDKKQFVFSAFYKYLYRINIKKNSWVITQQAWMAKEFSRIFQISNLLIAEPDTAAPPQYVATHTSPKPSTNELCLFYPAYPRYFKNHSIILKASELCDGVRFILTIDGTENSYSKSLINNTPCKNVDLLGLQKKETVYTLYEQCDALIFPSLLETWGLPLTEFKRFDKPIIAADLPYAHETLGSYDKIYWFSPNSVSSLLDAINRLKNRAPADMPKVVESDYPKLVGWSALASFILADDLA